MLVFNYCICVLEFYMMTEFVNIFVNDKSQYPHLRWSIYVVAGFLLFVINQLNITWINPLVSLLLMIIISCFLFSLSVESALMLSTFAVASSVILEFVSAFIFSFMVRESVPTLLDQKYGVLIISIISKTVFLLIIRFIKIYKMQSSSQQNYKASLAILLPTVSIFIMYSLLHFSIFMPKALLYSFWCISICILLIVINIIVFNIYDALVASSALKVELIAAKKSQEEQKNMFFVQEKHLDELKKLTHDYKNQLINIQSMYLQEDPTLAEYLVQLTGQLNNKFKAIPRYTTNDTINAILMLKKEDCITCDIAFNINIEFTDLNFITPADACIIFSNALDNALTACMEIDKEKQQRYINVDIKKFNNVLNISFENSRNPNSVLKYENNTFKTTKLNSELHGFGLINLKDAVSHYDGLTVFDYNKTSFKAVIIIQI